MAHFESESFTNRDQVRQAVGPSSEVVAHKHLSGAVGRIESEVFGDIELDASWDMGVVAQRP